MSTPSFSYRSHQALTRLLTFDLRLTCRTGLHIGAGKNSDLVGSDLPVMRDAAGRPLVPGSSLRGVLRAAIEAVAETLTLDRGVGRDPRASQTAPTIDEAWAGWGLAERLFGRVAQKKGEHSYASRLQISDLQFVPTEEGEVPRFELRDGVGIDRETRTAGSGVKYDHEVVPAGTRFAGRVRLKNPWDYEIGALAQALWMLDQGLICLGGKSARGLGWMQVEVSPPRVLTAEALLARAGQADDGRELASVESCFAPYLAKLEALRAAAAEGQVAREEAV